MQLLLTLHYTGAMKIKPALFIAAFMLLSSVSAQPMVDHPSLLGSWEGAMMLGHDDMTLALTIIDEDGQLQARLVSAGLGIYGLPADSFSVDDGKIKAAFKRLGAEFTGKLRLAEAGDKVLRIDGDWFQSAEMVPIVLLPVAAPSF
ncbi:MAG: hypothetical protein ACI95C_000156 [Pseudohongiellaceae bacterium]